MLKQAVGAAGRHPPVGAHQQAALPPRSYSYEGAVPILDVFRQADRRLGRAITKRAFDIVFRPLALMLLSPVMIAPRSPSAREQGAGDLPQKRRYGFNNEVIEV
jgi:lipopolysaccharide/colanic/teichoic acid biosynthesis glycosyltransferase